MGSRMKSLPLSLSLSLPLRHNYEHFRYHVAIDEGHQENYLFITCLPIILTRWVCHSQHYYDEVKHPIGETQPAINHETLSFPLSPIHPCTYEPSLFPFLQYYIINIHGPLQISPRDFHLFFSCFGRPNHLFIDYRRTFPFTTFYTRALRGCHT